MHVNQGTWSVKYFIKTIQRENKKMLFSIHTVDGVNNIIKKQPKTYCWLNTLYVHLYAVTTPV